MTDLATGLSGERHAEGPSVGLGQTAWPGSRKGKPPRSERDGEAVGWGQGARMSARHRIREGTPKCR